MALRTCARSLACRLNHASSQQPLPVLDGSFSVSCAHGQHGGAMQSEVAAPAAACLRMLHCGAQPRAAEGTPDDVEAANRELNEFFGLRHDTESHPGPTADSIRGDAQDGGGDGHFEFQREEPRPTQQDPQLAHPTPTTSGRLTHVDSHGHASMVDVAKKVSSQREAIASAKVVLGAEVYQLVASNAIAKGDVLTVAELAGIMGAKHTSFLIPLCHNIPLSYVNVKMRLVEAEHAIGITAEVRTVGPTGVEMEALTAASTAALTIYDMCKAVSRRVVITGLQLDKKTGGKSGTYIRKSGPKTDLGGD